MNCTGPRIIDRIARDVENAAEHAFANRHADRAARVGDAHPALQTFSRRHGDGANPVLAEMLLHFESQLGRVAADFVFDLERVVNLR